MASPANHIPKAANPPPPSRKSRNPRNPKPHPLARMASLYPHPFQFLVRQAPIGSGIRIHRTHVAAIGNLPIGLVQEAHLRVAGSKENQASPGTGTSTMGKDNGNDMINLENRLRPPKHTRVQQLHRESVSLYTRTP